MFFRAKPPTNGDDSFSSPSSDIDTTLYVKFASSLTERLCLQFFDTDKDGRLSYDEAKAVTNIDNRFAGSSIRSFDELKYFTSLTEIPRDAFNSCPSLRSITMPPSVTRIGEGAFWGCNLLEHVKLNEGLKYIGLWCFTYSIIKDIKLPESLEVIDQGAFYSCLNLQSITVPDSVKLIARNAFHNCYALTEAYIGNSVDSIGSAAFWGDEDLRKISLPSIKVLKEEDIFKPNNEGNNSNWELDTVIFRNGDPAGIPYSGHFSHISSMKHVIVPPGTAQSYRDLGYPNVTEAQ